MALIDYTYFKGPLTIGDISNGNSPVVGNTVTATYIPDYEDQYLQKALGYPLYKAFTSAIAAATEEAPLAQKWVDLRDGKEYTVNDETYKWGGFLNTLKISPIAYYVYCEYMSAHAVQATGTGTAVTNKQNATSTSPAAKIAWSWVEMKRLNADLWYFLKNNSDTYTEYDSCRIDWNSMLGSRNQFGI